MAWQATARFFGSGHERRDGQDGKLLMWAVRFEVEGEPYQSGLYYWTTCRKITGSVFSATANWKRSKFRMTGEVTTFNKRSFCPVCGSRLFLFLEDGVEVFLGSLDDAPTNIAPMVEVWTTCREQRLGPAMAARCYRRNKKR
jgi:hypothetical protein